MDLGKEMYEVAWGITYPGVEYYPDVTYVLLEFMLWKDWMLE